MTTASEGTAKEALIDALRRRGGRVTSQRLVINEILRELGRHATAEEIRERVEVHLPNVSLPTVYSTLELFEELGIVRSFRGGDGVTLYDPRTDPHPHLICESCGVATDLEAPLDLAGAIEAAKGAGFSPRTANLVVTGLCHSCASQA